MCVYSRKKRLFDYLVEIQVVGADVVEVNWYFFHNFVAFWIHFFHLFCHPEPIHKLAVASFALKLLYTVEHLDLQATSNGVLVSKIRYLAYIIIDINKMVRKGIRDRQKNEYLFSHFFSDTFLKSVRKVFF